MAKDVKDDVKASSETKAIEVWCAELKTPDWLFAAAKMHARWPAQRTVTREAYEAALAGAQSVTCR